MLFSQNATIIFQGDSITDAGRFSDADGLGYGYARMCARTLEALFPDYNLTIYNKGVSGDRVPNLVGRWQTDTIDLHPDLVSILIGVNDTWHGHAFGSGVTNEEYETGYRRILEQTKEAGAKIVIIEPFALHHKVFPESWRDGDFTHKIMIARKLAGEYADAFVPMEGLYYQAALKVRPEDISDDGVHPTTLGHRIMAEAWLKAVGAFR